MCLCLLLLSVCISACLSVYVYLTVCLAASPFLSLCPCPCISLCVCVCVSMSFSSSFQPHLCLSTLLFLRLLSGCLKGCGGDCFFPFSFHPVLSSGIFFHGFVITILLCALDSQNIRHNQSTFCPTATYIFHKSTLSIPLFSRRCLLICLSFSQTSPFISSPKFTDMSYNETATFHQVWDLTAHVRSKPITLIFSLALNQVFLEVNPKLEQLSGALGFRVSGYTFLMRLHDLAM